MQISMKLVYKYKTIFSEDKDDSVKFRLEMVKPALIRLDHPAEPSRSTELRRPSLQSGDFGPMLS